MISLALRSAAILALGLTITNYIVNEALIRDSDTIGGIANMFTFVIMIVVMFFGMKSIRSSVYNHEVTYGQAFYSGSLIGIFAAIGLGITTIIYFQFIRPDYGTLLSVYIEKQLVLKKASAAEIKKELDLVKKASVMGAFGASVFFTVITSVVVSCVLAAFVRTKDTFTGREDFGK